MDELPDGGKTQENSVALSEVHSKDTEIEHSDLTTDREGDSTGTEHSDGADIGATGGSEETFDMLCQQCLEEKKHVEACMYCTECEEYLCELCVNMHRRVRLTKGHTLILKDASGERNERVFENIKETCSLHSGETIDWFCPSHRSVCCLVCRSMYHDKCDGVVTLVAATEGVSIDERVKNALTELKQTQSHLCTTISQAQEFLKKLDEDRNESLLELENIKKEIEKEFERLNKLVSDDKNKIENKYKEIKENVETDVEKRKRVENTVAASIKILTNEKLNDVYKFGQVLKAESGLKALEVAAVTTFDDTNVEKIHYERDKTVFERLKGINNLGYIDCEKSLYSVSSPRKINVLALNEQKTRIVGICQINNQKLVLADWENSKLKLLNTSEGNVQDVLKTGQRPFDICKLGNEEKIAVTLPHGRKVKIFSLCEFPPFHLQGSLDTGEKCRGIAYFNSNLYVACGGGGTDNEGHGHIRVYGLDGKLQQTILRDNFTLSSVTQPWKIRFQPHTDKVLVTDTNKILTISTKIKNELCDFARNGYQKSSFSFDAKGRVFVTNYDSNSVDNLSVNGKKRAPLLTGDSLPSKPRDLVVDTMNSKLYVGMEDLAYVVCFDLVENKWTKPLSF